jgi:hypothetical protein
MEGDYKKHVRSGNVFGLAGEILRGPGSRAGRTENPLMRGTVAQEDKHDGFEAMNRDSGEISRLIQAASPWTDL